MAKALADTGLGEIVRYSGHRGGQCSNLAWRNRHPMRFEDPRQISRLAGYNLVEDSSRKNKSGPVISKRERKHLRSVLYQMAMIMVATNIEMKELHAYFKNSSQ
jgi:hypothetical protein